MKRARFTEEPIIAVLKEHEAGARTADLARKHGMSEATIYNWKAKFGGMDASEAKRLKLLEEENAKLKKLLAEQMLDARRCGSFCPKNSRTRRQTRRRWRIWRPRLACWRQADYRTLTKAPQAAARAAATAR